MVFDPTVRVLSQKLALVAVGVHRWKSGLITQNIAGVGLLGKKVNGSTIVPIEDAVNAKKKEDQESS